MTRPTFKMMSSTDPSDHSCTATIEIDGDVIEFEATNQVARKINDVVRRAYDEGMTDGRLHVVDAVVRYARTIR